MKVSELIKKLEKALKKYGDVDVLIDCIDDSSVNHVFYVDAMGRNNDFEQIRLTDGNKESVYETYDEDWDDSDMEVKEIR